MMKMSIYLPADLSKSARRVTIDLDLDQMPRYGSTRFDKVCLSIGLDTRGYQVKIFLFLHENICCGYSLEAPVWGTSKDYPQYTFSLRNKKISKLLD